MSNFFENCIAERPWIIVVVIIIVLLACIGFVIGPNRINRFWENYKSDAYGSDWLVIKENMNGDAIHYWELKNTSIGNEENSDGIYFLDGNEDIVHLSGFYTYIEVKDSFEKAKNKYVNSR
jgi:hypothetical protein